MPTEPVKPVDPKDVKDHMGFTKEQATAYVEKVVAKQCCVEPDEAKSLAAKLKPDQFTALHEHGRHGREAACCEIIAECCGDNKDVLAAIKERHPEVIAKIAAKKAEKAKPVTPSTPHAPPVPFAPHG